MVTQLTLTQSFLVRAQAGVPTFRRLTWLINSKVILLEILSGGNTSESGNVCFGKQNAKHTKNLLKEIGMKRAKR